MRLRYVDEIIDARSEGECMMAIEKRELIAEGKAKKIYATSDPEKLIFYFKDDATAFNAKKKGTIELERRAQQSHLSAVLRTSCGARHPEPLHRRAQ